MLWWDAEKTRIRFVPGSLLEPLGDWAHPETLNASRLDLSPESWNRIKTTVGEAVLQAREAGTSIQSMLADRCPKSAPHAGISFRQRKPLARHIIEMWDVAFVARVEELEGGWDPGVYAASTLVTVRPTMWLKRSQELDVDLAALSFVVRGGWLALGNHVVCEALPARSEMPEPGSTLLVVATIDRVNAGHLASRDYFPVDDSRIDTSGCPSCSDGVFVDLQALLLQVSGGE